jgi:CheY-like chemotaxis protein
MDGLQATRRLRALPGWQHPSILALTANPFDDGRRECIEVGMSDFITKPFAPDQLPAALLRWLGSSADRQCSRPAIQLLASITPQA